ncbi:sphingosine-1-phosphate phosphatase 2 [Osmerus mordax]|uniref:sphingosine-1-phosphate phosphatase 2 n=1 Tax=Osmerus mordax TaxID=8014 RepID=UPI00350FFE40
MCEIVAYLYDSELVAKFQRRCGLFLVEAHPKTDNPLQDTDDTEIHVRKRCRRLNGHSVITKEKLDNNSNDEFEKNEFTSNAQVLQQGYEVRNWLLHILFLVSASLGHEIFYITFLPCLHWNLDPFLCRRLVNMWALVMYIGQVLKDVLKLPRPLSPPVVKLESRVDVEYGLPSTHAIAATSIFFTLLLSAPSRVQFQFEVGLLVAVVLSGLVCLSRLYTGMHSALDVICGVLISAGVMLITYPYWETFEVLQLTSPFSPVIALALPLFLCYTYPELDHYSTTRGDTTTIFGSAAGCSVGYWVNEQLGETFEPQGVLPVPLPDLTLAGLATGTARFTLGVAALVVTRQAAKTGSLRVLCSWYRVAVNDREARRRKEIEVPYKFVTYTLVGLVNSIVVNRVFRLLGLL